MSDQEIGNGGLCPVGWCFVASSSDGVGDLCRSCKDYVIGSKEDHHPWVCPLMCKPSLNPNVAPYCQMADLLREDIMPSKHFGDAGMFPCRVGNDLQRSQIPVHVSDSGITKKKGVKIRLSPGSRKKLERIRQEKAGLVTTSVDESFGKTTSSLNNNNKNEKLSNLNLQDQSQKNSFDLSRLPPLPPPLLPDPPTPSPSLRSASLIDLEGLNLSRFDQVLIFIILSLTLIVCSLMLSKLRILLRRCASEETKLKRNEETLSRISDVARSINLNLDLNLKTTNEISSNYEVDLWGKKSTENSHEN
mmetsp:Transcript_17706/g.20883  ORF Transcript_17706/g.20883 Transcript_17706/m.20883 type:complete len:304 (-) Transcript_17706:162-1073(-)